MDGALSEVGFDILDAEFTRTQNVLHQMHCDGDARLARSDRERRGTIRDSWLGWAR